MTDSEWHSMRPWTRRLSLSIREITSVSATFILSSPFSNAESELSLVPTRVFTDDGLEEENEDSEFSETRKLSIVPDALAKGLSINVNDLPWQRVLIRIDDKLDEAIIIIYGLMPGRQYGIDLGLVHGNKIHKHLVTESSPIGDSSLYQDNEPESDAVVSDSHSPVSIATPGHPVPTKSPALQAEVVGISMTLEDRLKQLQQSLALINSDRDALTASLKSARRDAQKADAALRTEIDILKRASEKNSAAEHRARQKVLALQEAVKRAQAITGEMEGRVKETEAVLPVLMTEKVGKERTCDAVRNAADRVQEERVKQVERDRKRIEVLKGELSGLNNKLDRLGGKKEKLENNLIPDLEEQLKDIEREIQEVEAIPLVYRASSDTGDLGLDDGEHIFVGDIASNQVLASGAHHPSLYHCPIQRQRHHSAHVPAAMARLPPAPIQRPSSLKQHLGSTTRESYNNRSLLNPQLSSLPQQLLVQPSNQSVHIPNSGSASKPSSPVLPPAQTSTLSSRAPAFEPSLSITQALRATTSPSTVSTTLNIPPGSVPVHRPRPTASSTPRLRRGTQNGASMLPSN